MNDLTERLARQAEDFDRRGGTPLHLDQVLDRAGEIRRGRRLRATLVMAAAVLAIAVPAGLVALDRSHHEVQPAPPSQVDRSALTVDGLRHGEAPAIPYLQSGALDKDGFTYRSTGEPYAAVAEIRNGTMVAVRDADGNLVAHALDGRTSWPMSGDFAVSTDGAMVAFVEPDGTPVVVTADGSRSDRKAYTLPRIPRGTGFDAVAITGKTCDSPSDSVCAVWVTTGGKSVESWVSTPEGASPVSPPPASPDLAAPSLWRVSDVRDDGTRAGMTEVSDTGTCSEVESPDDVSLWATCDYRFLAFSPDGQHLLASSAYADGAGDNRLVVLDAGGGRPVLDLRTVDGAFIAQMVWEDDSHVLATVSDSGRWAVVRVGLDGSREYAVPPVTGDRYESPFVLASR